MLVFILSGYALCRQFIHVNCILNFCIKMIMIVPKEVKQQLHYKNLKKDFYIANVKIIISYQRMIH